MIRLFTLPLLLTACGITEDVDRLAHEAKEMVAPDPKPGKTIVIPNHSTDTCQVMPQCVDPKPLKPGEG